MILTELKREFKPAILLPSLTTGLIAAIVTISMEISLAALIFSGDLREFLGGGIGLMLFGAFVVGIVIALLLSVVVWRLLYKTTIGFEIRSVGANRGAAADYDSDVDDEGFATFFRGKFGKLSAFLFSSAEIARAAGAQARSAAGSLLLFLRLLAVGLGIVGLAGPRLAETFRPLYVFVAIEHGSRRLVRVAVTAHPTAAWTLLQLREVVGFDSACRYLIHERDSIFARSLDESIRNLGLAVLKSPRNNPQANAICERVIGTIRRECLDWLIPLSESHLRSILRAWVGHYNHGRPHMALGPGVPDPPLVLVPPPTQSTRHRIGECFGARARSVLGGLHHEYRLAPAWA